MPWQDAQFFVQGQAAAVVVPATIISAEAIANFVNFVIILSLVEEGGIATHGARDNDRKIAKWRE